MAWGHLGMQGLLALAILDHDVSKQATFDDLHLIER